jgi:hypothetical protein
MFIIPVASCVCERETVAKRILQITREAIQVNHQCNQCVSNLALITSMQLYNNNNNNKASNLKYLCSYIKYYSKPGMKPVSATDQKAKNDGCSFYINCLYILSHNMVCNLCQNKTSKKQIVLNREIVFLFSFERFLLLM